MFLKHIFIFTLSVVLTPKLGALDLIEKSVNMKISKHFKHALQVYLDSRLRFNERKDQPKSPKEYIVDLYYQKQAEEESGLLKTDSTVAEDQEKSISTQFSPEEQEVLRQYLDRFKHKIKMLEVGVAAAEKIKANIQALEFLNRYNQVIKTKCGLQKDPASVVYEFSDDLELESLSLEASTELLSLPGCHVKDDKGMKIDVCKKIKDCCFFTANEDKVDLLNKTNRLITTLKVTSEKNKDFLSPSLLVQVQNKFNFDINDINKIIQKERSCISIGADIGSLEPFKNASMCK